MDTGVEDLEESEHGEDMPDEGSTLATEPRTAAKAKKGKSKTKESSGMLFIDRHA